MDHVIHSYHREKFQLFVSSQIVWMFQKQSLNSIDFQLRNIFWYYAPAEIFESVTYQWLLNNAKGTCDAYARIPLPLTPTAEELVFPSDTIFLYADLEPLPATMMVPRDGQAEMSPALAAHWGYLLPGKVSDQSTIPTHKYPITNLIPYICHSLSFH